MKVDYDAGILLIEDLGSDGVLDADGRPIAERYRKVSRALRICMRCRIPQDISRRVGHVHHIPDFDRTAMKMEAACCSTGTCPGNAANRRPMPSAHGYLAIWDR
jgi:aminoglycoside/choline kinase family phosphotransferase